MRGLPGWRAIRGILCDVNSLALVELHKVLLLKPRVEFKLVCRRHHSGLLQQSFKLGTRKVGDSNRSCLAALQSLLQSFVSVDVVRITRDRFPVIAFGEKCVSTSERRWPMHQVQVEVVGPKIFQRRIKGFLNIVGVVAANLSYACLGR